MGRGEKRAERSLGVAPSSDPGIFRSVPFRSVPFRCVSASLPFLVSCSQIWGADFLNDPEVRGEGAASTLGGHGGASQGGTLNHAGGSNVGGTGGGVDPSGGNAAVGGAGGDASGASGGIGGGEPQICEPGSEEPCYTGSEYPDGVGICKWGTRTCDANGLAWSACSDEVKPQTESCATSADDDCDGLTTSDVGCLCNPGEKVLCPYAPTGVTLPCKAGETTCNGQGTDWSACTGEVLPQLSGETCGNGVDDDCNGSTDDGCACTFPSSVSCYPASTGSGVGLCHPGTQACAADGTHYESCLGAVTPVTEVCGNGEDDDCDGTVGQLGGWQLFTVDDSTDPAIDRGRGSSLAVDATGGVWVSYLETTAESVTGTANLKVAHKPHNGLDWELTPLLELASDDSATALGIDLGIGEGSGDVWVAYTSDQHALATRYRSAENPTWVYGGSYAKTMGSNRPSLRIDASQTVWLSVILANGDIKVRRRASGQTGWITEDVFNQLGGDTHTSLNVEAGEVWLAYGDQGGNLNIVKRGPSSWPMVSHFVTIGGAYGSLGRSALTGKLWASHYDAANKDLRVANRVPGDPDPTAGWTDDDVPVSGTKVGEYTSLAVDAYDTVWVSYYWGGTTNNQDLYVAHKKTGANWTVEPVDADNKTNAGLDTSLAVDPSGGIWVSYYDQTNKSLKVAYRCP